MRGYTQLTRDERYQIYALRKAGHSQKEIAEVLGRSPSTISRGLRRNKGLKGYRPEQSHRLAQNHKKERDRTRIPKSTWARVEQLLREDWSNVINLRPNSLFCRKISSFHHHLKESEMNSVPAVPTTDQAVLPKII